MTPSLRKSARLIALSVSISLGFSACDTPGETALLGAGTGAIIGNQSPTGSLRGAAIGAGVGYLVGKLVQHDRRRAYEEGYEEGRDDRDPDDRDEPRSLSRSHRPIATRTDRAGFVTSPFPPYNLIDTRGIPRGAQVLDPSVNRVFINP